MRNSQSALGWLWVWLTFTACASTNAQAALYGYVDDEGVMHFTDKPNDPRFKPLPLPGKENTYQWQDGVGHWQKIHQIDVKRYDALFIEAERQLE